MAFIDSLAVFLVSWIIGTLGIYIGANFITDGVSISSSSITALIGAFVWGVVTSIFDFAGLGAALGLIAWILVINWRHRGGIVNAILIGLASWIAAIAIIYLLSLLGLSTPQALGIPNV
jgi:hypothetical protein